MTLSHYLKKEGKILMSAHSPEKAKILVTGATGTVGGAVARNLVEMGRPIRVFVRDPAKLDDLANVLEIAVGDLSKPETLPPAMEGIERIFLVTADTKQDLAVISAAKDQGVRHIVKLSTQEAGMPGVEGHGHWHREREKLLETSGLHWTFLRPNMFMDTTFQWINSIRSEGVVYFPGGHARFPPIDPDDVGAVGAVSLASDTHLDKAFELTGPELLSVEEMVGILARVTGRSIRYVDIPESAVREQFLKMNMPAYVTDGLVATFRSLRAGKYAYLSDAVQRVLGRPPRTFESWCREHATSFA